MWKRDSRFEETAGLRHENLPRRNKNHLIVIAKKQNKLLYFHPQTEQFSSRGC
jgi:hypothetical protein